MRMGLGPMVRVRQPLASSNHAAYALWSMTIGLGAHYSHIVFLLLPPPALYTETKGLCV